MLSSATKTASAGLGLLLTVFFAPSVIAQGPHNPGVVPVNKDIHGKSYGEWAAAWWTWVLGIPSAVNPLFDATGVNAGVNQSGPVFFLVGTFGGTANRTITVPHGKSLFLPIVNWEWDTVPGFGPYPKKSHASDPLNAKDAYRLAKYYIDLVDEKNDITCTIDGRPVEKLSHYRAQSPVFSFTFAFDLWGPPYLGPFVQTAVTDGYWLMLEPLACGQHTIRFTAHIDPVPPDGPPPAWQGFAGFDLDVTYNITVQ